MSNRYYQPSRTPSPVVESPHSASRKPYHASSSSSASSSRSPSVSHRQRRAHAYKNVGRVSLLVGVVAIVAGVLHFRKAKHEKTLDQSERAERQERRAQRHRERRGRADYDQWRLGADRKMIEYPFTANEREAAQIPSDAGRRRRRKADNGIEYASNVGNGDRDLRQDAGYSDKGYQDRYSDTGRGRSSRRERERY